MGKSARPLELFLLLWNPKSVGVSRVLNAMNSKGCTGEASRVLNAMNRKGCTGEAGQKTK